MLRGCGVAAIVEHSAVSVSTVDDAPRPVKGNLGLIVIRSLKEQRDSWVDVGKGFSGQSLDLSSDRANAVLVDGSNAFGLIERLIAKENIECLWKCISAARRGNSLSAP
jgi:hypothetical protein